MKKIVILTHYFTPCTLTPSQRITYWAKNLNRLGFYPIVITRHWTSEIKSHAQTKFPLGDQIQIEKHNGYEVHYLPFRPGLLDWSYLRFGEGFLRPFFLFSKILDVFLMPFTLVHTSFSAYQSYVLSFFKSNRDVYNMIISGEPFQLFKIGYLLSMKYRIRWIADYRDDWSTSEVEIRKNGGFIRKVMFDIEGLYEKKWVRTADAITSVSDVYTDRIAEFTGVKGLTVENGFEEQLLEQEQLPLYSQFTLVYSGTLYPSQDISLLFAALSQIAKEGFQFKMIFLGTGYDSKERYRILGSVPENIRHLVDVTERVPRVESIRILNQSHLMIHVAHQGLKGIPSSKLYEYIALGKPVLLCPGDGDIMERILAEAGLGWVASSAGVCQDSIMEIMRLYSDQDRMSEIRSRSRQKVTKYGRFEQMKNLLGALED